MLSHILEADATIIILTRTGMTSSLSVSITVTAMQL
jgi:hypothetical protein